MSLADLVLLVVGILIGLPVLFGLTDMLLSTLRAVPLVEAVVAPGLVVALILVVIVQALPLGGAGFRLGAVLVGAAIVAAELPLRSVLGPATDRFDPYWAALAGTLLLLRYSERLGCARALTVLLVLVGFLIAVYGYPRVAWPGFGLWLTVVAGIILFVTER
jgi:hypothetical protein